MRNLDKNISTDTPQIQDQVGAEVTDAATQLQASRRRFLKNASLAGMSALVGMNIPFQGNLPAGS